MFIVLLMPLVPSAWALVERSCCNGNYDETCATIRIDCRKFDKSRKTFCLDTSKNNSKNVDIS